MNSLRTNIVTFFQIVEKELKTIFRDKRTLISMILPILIFPTIYYLVGNQIQKNEKDIAKNICIYSNIQNDSEKLNFVKNYILYGLPVDFLDCKSPKEALKDGDIYLIIDFKNNNVSEFPVYISVKYNSNSSVSSAAKSAILSSIDSFNKSTASKQIVLAGMSPEILNNVSVECVDFSVNALLVMIAPTLLSMMIITGCSSIAINCFAGEKERGTLERILTTRADRNIILLGKFCSVLIIGIFNALISLLAYIVSIKISPGLLDVLSESESLVFTLPIASSIIIVIFSYSVFIAAFLVTISIFSKSIKEAQSYLSLLSIIPSVIGILVMSSPEKIQSFFPLTIPIYNVIYLLKMLLGNSIDWNNCIIACASLFAYTFILLKLCSIMLKSEKYIM